MVETLSPVARATIQSFPRILMSNLPSSMDRLTSDHTRNRSRSRMSVSSQDRHTHNTACLEIFEKVETKPVSLPGPRARRGDVARIPEAPGALRARARPGERAGAGARGSATVKKTDTFRPPEARRPDEFSSNHRGANHRHRAPGSPRCPFVNPGRCISPIGLTWLPTSIRPRSQRALFDGQHVSCRRRGRV